MLVKNAYVAEAKGYDITFWQLLYLLDVILGMIKLTFTLI